MKHWKTFDRLVEEYDVYVDLSLKEMTKKYEDFCTASLPSTH